MNLCVASIALLCFVVRVRGQPLDLDEYNLLMRIRDDLGCNSSCPGFAADSPCPPSDFVVCVAGKVTGLKLTVDSRRYVAIPTEIGLLAHLTSLELTSLFFKGDIPTDIGRLSLLEHLYISSTSITGSIPTIVGALSSLTKLALTQKTR